MKKYRNWIVSALGLLLWAVGFWMVKGDVRSTLAYVCIGLGCGMFGYGAGELIAGRVLKGAPELQRQMEIDRQDERNVAIADRVKGRAFDLMTFLFGALMVSFALMGVELAARRTAVEGAVVDVDMVVACVSQSQSYERVSLLADKGVVDEVAIGVP